MNLSFAGCGFLGIYHVGVAACFKKYAPHLLLDKISGASFGAIAACCLLCDLPLGEMVSDVLRVVQEARSKTLGPFSPSFNIQNVLLEGMQKVLPEDAHLRVSGKLHISLTRVYDGKNVIVSQFNSKEDLQQALLASCFIPIFSGLLPPRFHGIRYMDGGFSDNLPTLDENTITVSPFCGESDICPRDVSSQLFHLNYANTSIELSRQNIYRFTRILFPPNPEILANMCKQGFDDALRFLHRNNLINCTRCLAVQSTFIVSESLEESLDYDPQCLECKLHRQEALVANLPDTVLTIFQDAIDSANKGLVNWIFKHRGMKLLSVLSLPYTLPADIVYATFTNIVGHTVQTRSHQMRVVGNTRLRAIGGCGCVDDTQSNQLTPYRFITAAPDLWHVSKYFLDQLNDVLNNINKKRQQLSAKITCQLALTEYGGSTCDIEAIPDAPHHVPTNNKMNFNFTLNIDDGSQQHAPSRSLSRWPSMTINRTGTDLPLDDDTFDHILQVTSHHEAIMAFYYMDENNKVKVTEIFDVTDADTSAMLSPEERENNTQLEYDSDWDEPMSSTWVSQNTLIDDDLYVRRYSSLGLSDVSYEEDYIDFDSGNILSDPESEWNTELVQQETKTPERQGAVFNPPDSLPESDQLPLDINNRPRSRKSSFSIIE
ncbi:1-acylglycerol-3-phosphate O-acyltransferase Pnpla3 isoform X1 [Anabrus simplex]|uniref:1-acylglycerol-3-phosphate O-acyltransferase Pnpla3 isoform X1 n=1 Tax=Anabrus simplex TaxID=316456 RepID=UPI0035A35101